MEKLFLLMPDLPGTRIDLDSQSNKKLTGAEIVAPVGIEKADLPGLVDDLAKLDADIKEEAARAIAEDKAHDDAIAQEVTDRIAGDAAEAAARDKAITAEAEARAAADSDLDAKIDKEIKAEAGAREAADIALGLRIDDVISNVDPAALDSLTEVVAAFQSADSDLNQAITDVLGTHTSELAEVSGSLVAAIAAEAADRAAADAAHDKAIAEGDAAVTAAFEAGDKALAEQLASDVKTLDGAIATEAKTREDADAAIIAAVGYNDRGDLASKLFEEYAAITQAEFDKFGNTEFYPVNEANFAAYLSRQDQIARENLDDSLNETIKASDEAQNKADAEIIAAVGYNDRGDASDVLYNEYAAQTEDAFAIDGNTEFYPVNEANFQAWLDKQAEIARQELDAQLSDMIKEVAEETSKADAAIIEAVGYNDRGAVSDVLYNEYAAQINDEITLNGGSEFAPVNEANFQAWLDAKTSSELKDSIGEEAKSREAAIAAETKAREEADANISADLDKAKASLDEAIATEAADRAAADVALGLRIDDVISNTDPAALDSLSEIVAAFQSADSDLNQAITDVLGTHTSELAALSGSLVAAIAAEAADRAAADAAHDKAIVEGDAAVTAAFEAGDKALAEQLASDVKTLDGAIATEAKTREDAISALSGSTAAADAAIIAAYEAADNAINDSIAKLSVDTNDQFAALDKAISAEIERATAAEGELDGKISDIISNTDLTALDSFSEVESGVNAGFASLKQMILEVAQNSVEAHFGAVVADGTQVLFAGYPTSFPKVFVNGLLQEEGIDYTVVGSVDGKGLAASDITFATAPVAGARVIVKGVESAHIDENRYETPVVFTPAGS